MGRNKSLDKARQEEIQRAIQERERKHRQKVWQDMSKYHKNRERLAGKVAAARKMGLSYGYYVALYVEFRGRLSRMKSTSR